MAAWDTNGNSGTDSSNFLGTTDKKALRIGTYGNTGCLCVDTDGNVGVGTMNPAGKLSIAQTYFPGLNIKKVELTISPEKERSPFQICYG